MTSEPVYKNMKTKKKIIQDKEDWYEQVQIILGPNVKDMTSRYKPALTSSSRSLKSDNDIISAFNAVSCTVAYFKGYPEDRGVTRSLSDFLSPRFSHLSFQIWLLVINTATPHSLPPSRFVLFLCLLPPSSSSVAARARTAADDRWITSPRPAAASPWARPEKTSAVDSCCLRYVLLLYYWSTTSRVSSCTSAIRALTKLHLVRSWAHDF